MMLQVVDCIFQREIGERREGEGGNEKEEFILRRARNFLFAVEFELRLKRKYRVFIVNYYSVVFSP